MDSQALVLHASLTCLRALVRPRCTHVNAHRLQTFCQRRQNSHLEDVKTTWYETENLHVLTVVQVSYNFCQLTWRM